MAHTFRSWPVGVATAFPNAANHLHKSATCLVSAAVGTPGLIERFGLDSCSCFVLIWQQGGVGGAR